MYRQMDEWTDIFLMATILLHTMHAMVKIVFVEKKMIRVRSNGRIELKHTLFMANIIKILQEITFKIKMSLVTLQTSKRT